MANYKVYDLYKNFMYKSSKEIYAKVFSTLCNNPVYLYKESKMIEYYWIGNEFENSGIKRQFINEFSKKLSFFAATGYYKYEDFPSDKNNFFDYIINEINYWKSCVYENGHTLNDMLGENPDIIKKELKKLLAYKKDLNELQRALIKY